MWRRKISRFQPYAQTLSGKKVEFFGFPSHCSEGQPVVPDWFQFLCFTLWGCDGDHTGKPFLWKPSPSDVGIHLAASTFAMVYETEIVSPWSFCAHTRRFRLGAQEWGDLEETSQCPKFENLSCDICSFTKFVFYFGSFGHPESLRSADSVGSWKKPHVRRTRSSSAWRITQWKLVGPCPRWAIVEIFVTSIWPMNLSSNSCLSEPCVFLPIVVCVRYPGWPWKSRQPVRASRHQDVIEQEFRGVGPWIERGFDPEFDHGQTGPGGRPAQGLWGW